MTPLPPLPPLPALPGDGRKPGLNGTVLPRLGRPPGSQNKTTLALKEAILDAAEHHGQDGKGEGGLVGYLRMVAATDVKSFCVLLGRVLPLQLTGQDGKDLKVEFVTIYEEKAAPPAAE